MAFDPSSASLDDGDFDPSSATLLDEPAGMVAKAKQVGKDFLASDAAKIGANFISGGAALLDKFGPAADKREAEHQAKVAAEAERLRKLNPWQDDADIQALAEKRVAEAKPPAKPLTKEQDWAGRVGRHAADAEGRRSDSENVANAEFDIRMQDRLQKPFRERKPIIDPANQGMINRGGYDPTLDARARPLEERDRELLNEKVRIQQEAGDLPALLRGAAGGFGQSLQLTGGAIAYLGDLTNQEEMRRYGEAVYRDYGNAAGAVRQAPSLTQVGSASDLATWLGEGVGYTAYQAGEALMSGAAGGLLAKYVGREAITGLMAKTIEKNIAAGMAKEEATNAAVSMVGAAVTAGGNNFRQELGSIYGDAAFDSNTLDKTSLGKVAWKALEAALVDTAAAAFGARGLGIGAPRTGGFATRLAKELPAQMGVQGGTEALQKVIEEQGAGKDPFRRGILSEYIDEFALGALGGAGPGMAGAFHKAPTLSAITDPGASIDEAIAAANDFAQAGGAVQSAATLLADSDANYRSNQQAENLRQATAAQGMINQPVIDAAMAPAVVPTLEQQNQQVIDSTPATEELTGTTADTSRLPDTAQPVTGNRRLLEQANEIAAAGGPRNEAERAIVRMAERQAGEEAVAQQEQLRQGPFALTKEEQRTAQAAGTAPIQLAPNDNGVPIIRTTTTEIAQQVVEALKAAGVRIHTVDATTIRVPKDSRPLAQNVVDRLNTKFSPPRFAGEETTHFPDIEETNSGTTPAEAVAQPAQQSQAPTPVATTQHRDALDLARIATPEGGKAPIIVLENARAEMGRTPLAVGTVRTLRGLGKLFKKKIVFFSSPDLGAEGAVLGDKGDNRIWVNVESDVDALRVVGHEVMHKLEQQAPVVYAALKRAMGDILSDQDTLVAMHRDYYQTDSAKSKMTDEEIKDSLKSASAREALIGELLGDLGGNRFTEAEFWTQVFDRIAAREGREKARGIIAKLKEALQLALTRMSKLLTGASFKADEFAKVAQRLDKVRDAFVTAYADYIDTVRASPMDEDAVVDADGQQMVVRETKERASGEHEIDKREAEKIKVLGFVVRGNVVSGSPPFINSLKDVRAQIRQAVKDASSDQAHQGDAVWYREAGRAIREYSHGDVKMMEKLTRIVAKLSQGAGVNSNVTSVIKAAYQIANGETPAVGRFPNAFREDFGPLVEAEKFDDSLKGVNTKLQNFYRNLHDEVFQKNEWPNAVVIDRHAINYIWHQPGKDVVASDAQYNYAERVIQLATAEHNKQTGSSWKPRDMQAVLWGWWKRREEAGSTEDAEHGGAWNYPQFFERATANVTAEVLPSTKVSSLDTTLSAKEKQQFQKAALDLIFKDGQNELARLAGLVLYKEGESTGGYEGKTNPNLVLGAIAQKVAKQSGDSDNYHRYLYDAVDRYALGWQYIFRQDGVPWFRADKTLDPADLDRKALDRQKRQEKGKKVAAGNEPPQMSSGFHIKFAQNLTPEDEAAMFEALRNDVHPAVGYTKLTEDSIVVINYRDENGIPTLMAEGAFKSAIKKFAEGDLVKESVPFAAESRYHYYDFVEENTGERILENEALQSGQRDLQDWLRGRREAFDALVADWEGKRPDATGSGQLRVGPEGSVRQSTRREGAVSATGIHYSREQRETLSSYYFGTGLNGAELERVKQATDPRIKQRIYFYVNTGRGINPESGVGAHAHQADLENLYDLNADSRDLLARYAGDANALESAILDAGFDGTLNQDRGIAVLIGPRSVPVEYKGTGRKEVPLAEKAQRSAYGAARDAIAARRDLPSGQMSGAAWKTKLPELDLSHLEDGEDYFKSDLVQKPRFSPSRNLDFTQDGATLESPIGSKEAIDEAQRVFLSAFPADVRTYRRSSGTAKAARAISDRAFDEIGASPTATREVGQERMGPFSGFETDASIERGFDGNDQLVISLWGKEQIEEGLMDHPALRMTVDQDGDFSIFGPPSKSKTFREFRARGWAEYATNPDGEIHTIDGNSHWTRLTGADEKQALQLLGDAHARMRAWTGKDHVGLHWVRTTGATGGEAGKRGAMFFSKVRGFKAVDTESAEFKRWSHNLPVIGLNDGHLFEDGSGVVVSAIHGTTGEFSAFDVSKANLESDLGGGLYFTNTLADVANNYAGEGPDLTSKLEMEAERQRAFLEEDEWSDGKADQEMDDEAWRRARYSLSVENAGASMPVYVRFDKPVVLGGRRETFFDYKENYNEELDEYEEPTGELVQFIEALREEGQDSRYDGADIESAISELWESVSDNGGISARDLIAKLSASEGLSYTTDMEHDLNPLASKEITRKAFAAIGYDGFIDQTVNKKFGSEKRAGKAMAGMNEGTVHFIAFSPTQIKSAISNTGEFSDTNPDIRYSRSRNEPFYSKLEDAVAGHKQVAMPAGMWRDWLRSNSAQQLGVKAEELKWSGVTDWLDMQGKAKVTKDDLVRFIQENGVKVKDVVLAQRDSEWFVRDGTRAIVESGFDTEEDAQAWADENAPFHGRYYVVQNDEPRGDTNFGGYVLPGGENYKELLITLPGEAAYQTPNGAIFTEEQLANPVVRSTVEKIGLSKVTKVYFQSSHFDQPNILAHLRMNERTDADGNRVLFLEEVQGDWPQQYRKQVDAIGEAVDNDFLGIVERMKKDGVLEVECD